MNRIRTATAAVAMLLGAATVAGAQAPPGAQGGHGEHGKAHNRARGEMNHLNLTDAQKEQMKAIHAKYRTQFQQLREQSRPDMEAARTARQAGDTAAARAAIARARANGPAVSALMQQQQAEIRAMLTAEQRVQFDAHQAQMQQRKAHRDSTHGKAGARGERGRDARGPRGARGQRPDRGARPARPARPAQP